jgi:serine/threonine-protein kinase
VDRDARGDGVFSDRAARPAAARLKARAPARDSRLGRDVALKIRPPVFAADSARLARFDREARLLASLNHPNIGAIHGVEESTGVHGLVLELVEGETLAELIARGMARLARR